MPWYHFSQNNSGGVVTRNANVDWEVYIEANSAHDANHRAEAVGIYFHGVSNGRDCECCGDRWYEADDTDQIDNIEVHIAKQQSFFTHYAPTARTWIAHYLDGTVRRGDFCEKGEKPRPVKVTMIRNKPQKET